MLNNVIKDLDTYAYRLGLSKPFSMLMVFIYPVTWPIVIFRYGHWVVTKCNIPLIKQILFIIYFIMTRVSEIFTCVEIGHLSNIGKGLHIVHLGDIVIRGEIGVNCNIRNGVTIGGAGRKEKYGYPTIGDNVYIGAGAKILGIIKVGNNVIIGANAVVVKDVPDNAVVGGVPAKLISYEGSADFVHYREDS